MTALGVSTLIFGAICLWVRPSPSRVSGKGRPAVGLGPVGFVLVVFVAWLVRSLVLPLVALQVGLLGGVLVRRVRSRQVQKQFDVELVTFVEDLSQQLRSGGALASAFLSTLPRYATVEARLEPVVTAALAGVRLEQALDEVARRETHVGLRLLVASVSVLTSRGGSASTSLERLAHTLRDAAAARDEAWAQASQVLASAVVLAALPLIFAGSYAVIEPDIVDFYLRTPLGAVCLVAMLGLITIGALWIDRVIGSVR